MCFIIIIIIIIIIITIFVINIITRYRGVIWTLNQLKHSYSKKNRKKSRRKQIEIEAR